VAKPRRGFNSTTAKEAGRKSGAARRARKAERDLTASEASTLIDSTNADLGPLARVTAAHVMGRVLSGEIPVRNGSDAASVLRVAHDVARLEAGEATAITVSTSMSDEGIAVAAEQLRAKIVAARGAARELEPGEATDPLPAIEVEAAGPTAAAPGQQPSTSDTLEA